MNKEFYNDNMIYHCRRQGPGEHIHQLPKGGDSKNRKMSDSESRRFQKDVISGNPIFGKIDQLTRRAQRKMRELNCRKGGSYTGYYNLIRGRVQINRSVKEGTRVR